MRAARDSKLYIIHRIKTLHIVLTTQFISPLTLAITSRFTIVLTGAPQSAVASLLPIFNRDQNTR